MGGDFRALFAHSAPRAGPGTRAAEELFPADPTGRLRVHASHRAVRLHAGYGPSLMGRAVAIFGSIRGDIYCFSA
jgi:hypothetical protein